MSTAERPAVSVESRFDRRRGVTLPTRGNSRLATLLERVNDDPEAYALWIAANVTAVDRMRISEHGPVHVRIVANSGLRLLRLLVEAGVELEGGILRVADALDMAHGRSRIPFREGSTSIHSVSAAAIEAVHIERGETAPVRIRVEMTNSAGVFQLDQLLRRKLRGSGLERHVEVEATMRGEEEMEKRLVERFRL